MREPDSISEVYDPATGEYTGIYGVTYKAAHGVRDSDLPWYCKLAAMMLIDRAKINKWEPRGWDAFPSLPLLAADCGVSYTIAARAVRELRDRKLLAVEQEDRGGVNHYILDCHALADLPKRPKDRKYTPKKKRKG